MVGQIRPERPGAPLKLDRSRDDHLRNRHGADRRLLATAPAAHANEEVDKGRCSITYKGQPTLRVEDCVIDVSMSQGRAATIVVTPDGKRWLHVGVLTSASSAWRRRSSR